MFSIRAQITTETDTPTPTPAKKVEKVSKKNEEGVIVNKYRPKEPYTGKCLLNTKITADDAPGETWHMVFSHQGRDSVTCSHKLYSSMYDFFLGGD